MTGYVALLRAVNVGGTGRLEMAHLSTICEAAGFEAVRTYIASGNVVFRSSAAEPEVKAALEARLEAHAGRSIGVMVRSASQMAEVVVANPFPQDPGNRVVAIFLDDPPAVQILESIVGKADEEVALGRREIYVRYGTGMAASKLRIPVAASGTARNMNTVTRLTTMAAAL